jgi:hypothetical protein
MTQWLKPHTRYACKLAQTACISALLVAALSGCNEDKTPVAGSTFDVPAVKTQVAAEVPKDGPVKGTVTPVPGTEPEKLPQTDGGNAIALPAKVGRFTEIAPDTAGGATFRSSPEMEYDLGNLVASEALDLTTGKDDNVFITPISGWLNFPQEPISPLAAEGRFPIIIFEHGMGPHGSYKGYNYLAEELASHGYVVLSIDADAVNDINEYDGQARAQLFLGTLDRLRQIDKNGQVGENGESGPLDVLKGKLDFTRIGIMGHSRGGQGVSSAIKYNQTRVGVSQDDLMDALKKNPGFLKIGNEDFSDLAASVTPGIEYQAAVAGKAASIDEKKLTEIVTKHGITSGGISIDTIKAVLLSDPFSFDKIFPDLKEAIIPAVPALPAIAAVPASIDTAKFDAAIKKHNIFYAAGRETIPPYDFKGAFMLAPMDNNANLGVNNVPLANLLPSCDGDVANLDGALSFDHNRFGPTTDTAPRYQILVKGANHDFYNRQWGDDGTGEYCSPTRKDSIRLNRPDQERNGLFLINSFMRYHVGGEQKFAAYWNGTAQLPDAACQSSVGPCDERVDLTVQKGAKRRKLIARFERDGSIDRNELGGTISLKGFADFARCEMSFANREKAGDCTPTRLAAFEYKKPRGQGLLSNSDHLELAWSAPNASIVTDLKGLSARGMDSLTFRIGVVRPMGQEVLVTLTDTAGRTSTLTASDFSNALYNAPRPKADGRPLKDHPDDLPFAYKGEVKILMNMVAIPLKAFEGVDTNNLKELKLVFPKDGGKVAITDIQLQNLGREKPAQKLARQ